MSIELGFARWQISDDFEIDLIDVPGHEKFVGTMTSGASGIEAAILVISVEDGIMPQTREHLRVLEFLGVQSLIVALSKCDLADDEIIEWQREEINHFFETQRLKPIEMVNISTLDGLGLNLLAEKSTFDWKLRCRAPKKTTAYFGLTAHLVWLAKEESSPVLCAR